VKFDIPYNYRKFYFESRDKTKLCGIEYIPNQKPKGTIIGCHYLGGSKTSIYSYIEPLLKNGFRVVSFDYPNHGESMDRKGNKYTLEDDMHRFLLKIKELEIEGPYAAYGLSMGATIAISATDYLKDMKAIVVDSGPLIFVKDYFIYVLNNKKIKNKFTRVIYVFLYLHIIGFFRMSKRMKKRINKLAIPILIIHGRRDKTISYRNAEYLNTHWSSLDSKLITVEKGYHLTNRVLLGEVYDKLVVDFFEKFIINDSNTLGDG
jgi:alpha-beta hydrolase superfamily lysophospholipase